MTEIPEPAVFDRWLDMWQVTKASAAYRALAAERDKLKAELEEAQLARGRLRLWLEFISLNCDSHEAKEFAGEALIGRHVPEGFEQ